MTENNDSGFKQNNFTKHDNNTCRASENFAHKVSEMGKEGDIGVFENALSFEQNGNLFNGSSPTEKQVSEILIETAKTIIEYLQKTTETEDKQVKLNIFKRLFLSSKH